MKLPVALRRLAFRVGYQLLRPCWLIFRPRKRGAKCVILRGGDVLLVRHTYGDRAAWEIPGGGVKRTESPRDAARREVREELGVDLNDWRSLGDLFARIDHRRDTLCCFETHVEDLVLEIDRAEIAEARWFPREQPPHQLGSWVPQVLRLTGN